MNITEPEQQILRVKATSFQTQLDEALEQALRIAVLEAVKTTLAWIIHQSFARTLNPSIDFVSVLVYKNTLSKLENS